MAQATKQVRDLFKLPNDENIFDDFSCSLNGMPGRLYLSQNYLCFFSTLLGRTTKHILKFQEISKITKSNNRIQKIIKVHQVVAYDVWNDKRRKSEKNTQSQKDDNTKVETFKFYGFKDRDMTFKYVKRLWSHTSPYADQEESDSNHSDEYEDEVSNSVIVQNRKSSTTERLAQRSTTFDSQSVINKDPKRKTILVLQGQNQQNPSDIFVDASDKQDQIGAGSQREQGNAPADAEFNDEQEAKQTIVSKQNVPDSISKQELESHSSQFPFPEGHQQFALLTLNLSPQAFYEQYISNASTAPVSLYTFLIEDRKGAEAKIGEFVTIDNDEDKKDFGGYAIEGATQVRKQFYNYPVDTPFVKNAETFYNFWLQDYGESFIRLRQNNRTQGVPYCDCFYIEYEIIIAMPQSCQSSCILRVTGKCNWVKSAMLKSFITGKSAEEAKEVWIAFSDWVKKNGHNYKPAKSDKKLKHGIEKILAKKDRQPTTRVDREKNKPLSLKVQEELLRTLEKVLQSPNVQYAWTNRNEVFQIFVLFFMFYMMIMQLSMRMQMGALVYNMQDQISNLAVENSELKAMLAQVLKNQEAADSEPN